MRMTMPHEMLGIGSSYDQSAGSHHSADRVLLDYLARQVAASESLLDRGLAPSIDSVVRIRAQVFELFDNQYREPLAPRSIGGIANLGSRICDVYARTKQRLQTVQSRSGAGLVQPRTYMLTSPDGYRALISAPGVTQLAAPIPPTLAAGHAHRHRQHNNNVVLENVVRQAVLNHGRRRQHHARNSNFARNIRRLWLFVRLYFFCYVLSEPGTWSHLILMILSALTALLSETAVPQYLYGIFVSPVQRHLEGLLHFEIDEPSSAAAAQVAATGAPGQSNTTLLPVSMELRNNIRRVERSLALFIASLIPGVGERHVEARNAVEAAQNAERRHAEEEHQREQEHQHEMGQNQEGERVAEVGDGSGQ